MTEGTARDDAAVPRLIQSLGYALCVFHATLLAFEPGASQAAREWATGDEGYRVRSATAERLLRDAGAVLRSGQRYWSQAWEVDGVEWVRPQQVAAQAAASLLAESVQPYSQSADGILMGFQIVRRPLKCLGELMEDEFKCAIDGVFEARNYDSDSLSDGWIRGAAYDLEKLLFGCNPWPHPA